MRTASIPSAESRAKAARIQSSGCRLGDFRGAGDAIRCRMFNRKIQTGSPRVKSFDGKSSGNALVGLRDDDGVDEALRRGILRSWRGESEVACWSLRTRAPILRVGGNEGESRVGECDGRCHRGPVPELHREVGPVLSLALHIDAEADALVRVRVRDGLEPNASGGIERHINEKRVAGIDYQGIAGEAAGVAGIGAEGVDVLPGNPPARESG